MKKIRILLTTVGGVTSPDIIRCLKKKSISIYGVDKNKNAVGKFFVDKFLVIDDSKTNKLKFVKKLIYYSKKFKINFIIPCGNDDNIAINIYKKKIKIPVLNSLEYSSQNYFDKLTVYHKLKSKLPELCPNFIEIKDYKKNKSKITLPFIIKPSLNTGGRGVLEVKKKIKFDEITNRVDLPSIDEEKFNSELNILRKKKYLIMDKLHGPIVSVYSICLNGKNFFSVSHIREWGNASQTFRGKVFYDKKFEKMASKIVDELNLSYAINMEFAYDNKNNPKLFDLNPRIGASFAVHKNIGLNLPLIALNVLRNKNYFPSPNIKNLNHKFYRYFSNVWTKR